jgi:DNA-binding NarL/FixJ family response regulator
MIRPPASATGLRVVVADGNQLVARGLAAVLADAGALVLAQEFEAAGALDAVARQDPDVLVVSLDLPGTAPDNVVAIARDRWPGLGIVAMSAEPEDEAVLAALALGASAHVARSAEPDHIVTAIAQAAANPGAFLADDPAGAHRRVRAAGPGLTLREMDVLRLAAEGLTVREMSARLYVSEATTRSHLSGIYRKLGVTSRSQAVLAAERQGLLR